MLFTKKKKMLGEKHEGFSFPQGSVVLYCFTEEEFFLPVLNDIPLFNSAYT